MDTSASSIRVEQAERKVLQQEGCGKTKWGVITGVALLSIALVGVGSLSLIASYQLLPHVFAPLGQMPSVATGVFLGSGGILLTGLVVYSLQQCFAAKREQSVVYEPPLPSPGIEEIPKEEVPLPVEVRRVSLLDAMERFQIYDSELAKRYPEGEEIPSVDASREAIPLGENGHEKTGQKIELLKALLEEYPEWKEVERFTTWVSHALLQLKKECEKSEYRELGFSMLAPLEQALQIAHPAPPSLPEVVGDSFPPLVVERVKRSPDVDYPGVEVAANAFQPSQKLGVEKPEGYPAFTDRKRDLRLMKEWHSYLFALYEEGSHLEKAESEVAIFLLEPIEEAVFSSFLDTLSLEEKSSLLTQFEEITTLLVTLHVVLGRLVFHPSRMVASIKAFGKMVTLVQKMDNAYFKGFMIGISIEKLFLDNYLDLGPYQVEIQAALDGLSSKGRWFETDDFYKLVKYQGNLPNDPKQAYLTKDERKGYEEDYSGEHLPPPVVQLRRLSVLLRGFFSPHQRLSFGEPLYKNREEFPDYIDKLRRTLKEGGEALLEERQLLSVSAGATILPLGIQVHKYWGLDRQYNDLRRRMGIPLSPFYGISWMIQEKELRNRLIEGTVSSYTHPNVDEDGNISSVVVKPDHKENKYGLDGLKQSPFNIFQEKFLFPKLSLEASRDLQLMASGKDNRASNALYTFAKHPHLLFHEEYRKEFRRIFRLLVFRKDLLLREMEYNPSSIPLLFGKTEELLDFFSKTNFDAWAFLFTFQIDFLQCLPEQEKRAFSPQHLKRKEELKGWIQEVESGENSELHGARSSLHLAYLYEHAIFGFEEEEVIEVCQSYLVSQAMIENLLIVSPQEGQFYYDLGVKLHLEIGKLVKEKGVSILDTLLAYRMKGVEKQQWEEIEPGVYKSETLLLDLRSLKIVQNGQMEGALPREIRENDSFLALLGKEVLQEMYTFTLVETPLGRAWYAPIVTKTCSYALYFKNGDRRFPLVFRKKEEGEWEQWIEIQEVSSTVPKDFLEGFCWRQGEDRVIETPYGKPIYRPTFEREGISCLDRLVGTESQRVLDPGEEELFSRLDIPGSYVVTESRSGTQIHYLRGKIRYVWNRDEGRWESPVFKGYSLCPKRVEKWHRPGTQEKAKPLFFASHFDRYHILEGPEGRGKLLLAVCEYERVARSGYVLVPKPQPIYQEGSGLVIFDLEKNGYLVSKNPLDSFYLSYLLFIQGKYGDALLYLERSQAVWSAREGEMASMRHKIKEWILNWKDDSPNGHAFLVHMLLQEHQLTEANFLDQGTISFHDNKLLPPLFREVESFYQVEGKVDPLLRLGSEQKEDLIALLPRARSWTEAHQEAEWIPQDIRTFCRGNPKEEEVLSWALAREIRLFEEKLQTLEKSDSPTIPEPFTPKPLLDLSSWFEPLEGSRNTYSETFAAELQEVFSGETLADEMGLELAKDLLFYKEKVEAESTLRQGADLTELKNEVIAPHEKALRKEEKRLRNQILQFFLPPVLNPGEAMGRKLQEQEALFDHLFEKARFCFGLGDYSQLVNMGAIRQEQVDSLNQLLLRYEIVRTDRQLLTRKREGVEKLLASPDDQVLLGECWALLQSWRGYDPEAHPFARLLLLFEDELNLTARESQLIHIRKLAAHKDAYIHEAMAGGKTTLLRNIFSAIQGRNGYLAGVVTYSPLMAMHHKEYATVNQLAMGSRAYPVFFNRNAPHDATALQLMILYHLKALARQGLIDQTPQAALSLNHTLTELTLAIRGMKDKKTLATFAPQIQALQKLLRIRGEHLSVYSDEIDKIFDPSKDHNYAHGQAHVLGEEFYRPALVLTRLLLTTFSLQEFLEALRGDHLQRMGENKFEELLRKIAEEAFAFYRLPFDQVKTLDYLTEVHQQDPERQAEVRSFYETEILVHPDNEIVATVQILHSYIGVLLRGIKNKRVGTDFGRSQDGIHVKPYSFSAVCQESSQRSFVLSTILETCLDYVVSGISEEGVDAYIETVREQASHEIDEKTSDLDHTAAGGLFHERFGVALSRVTKKHHSKILEKVEASYDLFEECLCEILFRTFTYHAEKMEGNAHLLSHLIHSFSGSSGSPERVKTLPGSIQKHEELIRQKGAIGSVFYSLFLGFDPETDLLSIDPNRPFAGQIAAQLRPGNTLIDSAPFFSGMQGEKIVEVLAPTCQGATFRFLDEEDDIAIWEEGSSHKGEAGIDLSRVISIIPHKGRQGTNWKFAPGTEGIVGVGIHLDLTSFYQSLMRLRLLGKGQRGKIAYDAALEEQWEGVVELEGKSLLTKIVWSLVQNEAKLLKRLHYQANKKEIRLVRACAIDQIKQEVTNIADLALIQEMESFELVVKTPLDPTQCGAPIEMGSARSSLQKLLETEREKLKRLKEEVEAHTEISKESICKVVSILETNLVRLSEEILLDPKELPDSVAVNFSDVEATEEIEIELDQEIGQEAQVEQELSLEVEMEVEMEQGVEVEIDEIQDHPYSQMGTEYHYYSIFSTSSWWNCLFDKNHGLRNDFFVHNYEVDGEIFPGIYLSNHGLGLYNGTVNAQTPEGERIRKGRVWCFGDGEEQAPLSSKVLVLIKDDRVVCQMGSVKDADFYFYEPLMRQKWAKKWIELPFEKAKTRDLASFPLEHQRETIEDAKTHRYGEAYYNQEQKRYVELQTSLFIKFDLQDSQIPDSLPEHLRQTWIEKIALAKFLYFEAQFSQEELDFLSSWLETSGFNRAELKERLTNYMRRFFPSTRSHPLLNLLS